MTNSSTHAKNDSNRPTDQPTPGKPALTAFQRNILVILAEDARYGLAVKDALEDYYGTEVNHGRLYPNLDDLVQEGFVAKSELDKRTYEYALTSEGEQYLERYLAWVLGKVGDRVGGRRLRRLATDGGTDTITLDGDTEFPWVYRCGTCEEILTVEQFRDHEQDHDAPIRRYSRVEIVETDGGQCAECGAILPDEIVPDTGVYCPQCGHGQLVTDGGTNASPELPSLLDVGATGAHWQQELADENIGSATYGGTFGLIHIHAGEDAKLFDQHRRHIYSAFDDALEELVGDLSDAALESRQGEASKQALFDQIATVDAYDLRSNFLAWLQSELDIEGGEA